MFSLVPNMNNKVTLKNTSGRQAYIKITSYKATKDPWCYNIGSGCSQETNWNAVTYGTLYVGVWFTAHINEWNSTAEYYSSFKVGGGDKDVLEVKGDGIYFNGKKRNESSTFTLLLK